MTLAVLTPPVAAAALTPYERMAQSDLVVHVRTVDGSLRLAQCEVLGVIRGAYEGSLIQVAFRSDNLNRERWKDRIVFEEGAESVLMLRPAEDADGDLKQPDLFRLVGGFHGKIDLPREGAPAYLQAFRRLGEILDLTDIHQVWQAHRNLLLETNPYLVETGFAEVLKFRLGDASLIPALLEHLNSQHDRFRVAALEVLSQVFEETGRDAQPLGNEDHVVARILTVAVEDPAEMVRVAAVRALRAYGRPHVVSALRRVAQEDPSQDVRYQATLSVYELSRDQEAHSAP